jgi:hexosaminidase
MRITTLIRLAGLLTLAACARNPRPSPGPTRVRNDLPRIAVIPAPMRLTENGGRPFRMNAATAIVADSTSPEMQRALAALTSVFRPSTGFALPVMSAHAPVPIVIPPAADSLPHNAIVLRLLTFIAPDPLGSEGYTLRIDRDTLLIQASSGAGLYHGVQTVRQLLTYRIEDQHSAYAPANRDNVDWSIPALTIEDMPRYRWRGSMLDVSRHFFEVNEVKQHIDLLALYKLNTLHLHLADDQGWRIEIKSRPELAQQGAPSEVAGGPGGFFTQADYQEIVRYANERYVTIVPEIDMPAHINAALISHPELSCGRRPPAVYTGIQVGFSAICPESAGTYALIEDVIRELVALSPGGYFHIGGDEVQALNAPRYASFIERVQGIVRKYDARMIGWEEVGKTQLDPTSIIQQWQRDTLVAGINLPNDIIVSAGPRMYLDMKYDSTTELGLRWAGMIDLRKAYDWEPTALLRNVSPSRIIGLEAPLWSETVRNITAAQYLLVPRLPALAELAWSPQSVRSWDSFRKRVAVHGPRWNLLGINYHRDPSIPW